MNSNIFKHTQTYSNIFKHIQTYSNIFKRIQTYSIYSNIFKHIQTYSNIFQHFLTYFNISIYVKLHSVWLFGCSVVQNFYFNKGSHQKKTTKLWTLSKHWGVSGAAKPFIEKRYGHVLRGEGGQRAMSKVVFCKKSLFWGP